MEYSIGKEEDEEIHKKYHNRVLGGILWKETLLLILEIQKPSDCFWKRN